MVASATNRPSPLAQPLSSGAKENATAFAKRNGAFLDKSKIATPVSALPANPKSAFLDSLGTLRLAAARLKFASRLSFAYRIRFGAPLSALVFARMLLLNADKERNGMKSLAAVPAPAEAIRMMILLTLITRFFKIIILKLSYFCIFLASYKN